VGPRWRLDPDDLQAGLFDEAIALRVLALGAWAAVAVAIDLDDEPFVGPEQIHLDESVGCLNTGIDERGWEVGGLDLREDLILEVALGAGAAVGVGFEGSLQDEGARNKTRLRQN
jgi:hypothetical protein